MKKLALGLALSFAASTTFAGGMDDPIVTPVMVPDTVTTAAASSSAASPKTLIALMALVTFATILGD